MYVGFFSGETRKAPLYDIILRGYFESNNGEDFSPSCSNQHSSNFYESAQDTMTGVNLALGNTLCAASYSAAFTINSVSALFYVLDTSVSTTLLTTSGVYVYISHYIRCLCVYFSLHHVFMCIFLTTSCVYMYISHYIRCSYV